MPVPTINSFTASATTVYLSQSVTFTWSTTGATSATISTSSGASNSVAVNGTYTDTPITQTYTLTAHNASGNTTSSIFITAIGAPTINSYTATPALIRSGGSSTLTWDITNATAVSITAPLGVSLGPFTGGTGSVSVTPTEDGETDYTLTASNPSPFTAVQPIGVTIVPPLEIDFTASPLVDGTSTLSWTVGPNPPNPQYPITITGIDDQYFWHGDWDVTPTSTTTYTLTATDLLGTVYTATATVAIGAAPGSMPSSPLPKAIDFNRIALVGNTDSPFNGMVQTKSWGVRLWEATITMPPMGADTWADWQTFFVACKGPLLSFVFPDALCSMYPTVFTTDGTTPRQFRLNAAPKWSVEPGQIFSVSFDVRENLNAS